jgi:multidrug efflux pump subunit AcrA (membrane-fusion protein)
VRTYDDAVISGRARRVALAVAVGLGLAGCTGDGGGDVEVATVGRATVTEVVEAPATVAARASATVTSPADGSVAELRVREGQEVRAGQVLLRIESPSARRQLRQALRADDRAAAAGTSGGGPVTLAGAAQADAQASRAFARARRAARRIPDPAARRQALSALEVSQSQYRAARSAADQAAAQLAAGLGSLSDAVAALSSAQRVQTRAAVEVARQSVAALVVRAPVGGTVSLSPPPATAGAGGAASLLDQLPANLQGQAGSLLGGSSSSSPVDAVLEAGRPVSRGQGLLTVTDASQLALTAQVDETDVLLVRAGVPASAELDAVPDATYEAAVTTVDPTPTQSSRGGVTYVVRLSLGRGRLADGTTAPTPRPGMSAVVDLVVRTARDTVAVPAAAVFRDGRRDAVWLVRNGRAREERVRLGAQGKARVEVLEGLQVGDRVVVRGADQVRAGDEVP